MNESGKLKNREEKQVKKGFWLIVVGLGGLSLSLFSLRECGELLNLKYLSSQDVLIGVVWWGIWCVVGVRLLSLPIFAMLDKFLQSLRKKDPFFSQAFVMLVAFLIFFFIIAIAWLLGWG